MRESMYKELEAKGKLSASDAEPLSFDQHCLVGVTKPLDSSVHEILKREKCDFEIVIPKTDPFYVSILLVEHTRTIGRVKTNSTFRYSSPSTWISQAIVSVGL